MRLYSLLLTLVSCFVLTVASSEATGSVTRINSIVPAGKPGIAAATRLDASDRQLSAPASVATINHSARGMHHAGADRHNGSALPSLLQPVYVIVPVTIGNRPARLQRNAAVISFIRSLIYPEHSFW